MSNPFEAAIRSLQDINSRGGGPNHSCPQCESRRAAIRVLEAAGEMPQAKERLLPHFEELAHIQCFYCKGIRAILAALPDGEKK